MKPTKWDSRQAGGQVVGVYGYTWTPGGAGWLQVEGCTYLAMGAAKGQGLSVEPALVGMGVAWPRQEVPHLGWSEGLAELLSDGGGRESRVARLLSWADEGVGTGLGRQLRSLLLA